MGNKCDLSEKERVVSTEEGKLLAQKYQMPFVETSAQEDINIKEMFTILGREILRGSDLKKNSGVVIGKNDGNKERSQDKKCC